LLTIKLVRPELSETTTLLIRNILFSNNNSPNKKSKAIKLILF
jgi:hypothetical protein